MKWPFFALVALLWPALPAFACECGGPGKSVAQIWAASSAVILATVENGRETGWLWGDKEYQADIRVIKRWKGHGNERFHLVSWPSSCGYDFRRMEGKTYVFFLSEENKSGRAYRLMQCADQDPVLQEQAAAVIKQLDDLTALQE